MSHRLAQELIPEIHHGDMIAKVRFSIILIIDHSSK